MVVTDGFTGNVVLKASEGGAADVTGLLRAGNELTRCIAEASAWLPARQRGKGATEEALSD